MFYGNENKHSERIGCTFSNKYGSLYDVVGYENANHVEVKFRKSKHRVSTSWKAASTGQVRCPFDKSYYGVGYLGVGKYKRKEFNSRHYNIWTGIIRRCYAENNIRAGSYKDVTVCETWHNFQNFAEWFCSQRNFLTDGWEIDKDIIKPGSRLYSEDCCVLVPKEINIFVTIQRRGIYDLPCGVYKKGNLYIAEAHGVYLGCFDDPDSAFLRYKEHKTLLAKKLAEKWSGIIDDRVYKSLLNFDYYIDLKQINQNVDNKS